MASCTRMATEVVLADFSLKHQLSSQDMEQLIARVGTQMADTYGGGGTLGACLVQHLTPKESLLEVVRVGSPVLTSHPSPPRQEEDDSSYVAYLLSATRDVLGRWVWM